LFEGFNEDIAREQEKERFGNYDFYQFAFPVSQVQGESIKRGRKGVGRTVKKEFVVVEGALFGESFARGGERR
jgi:hypothetical protein